MGNYVSRQAQLENELNFMLSRLMNKKTVEKSDVMSLVNKFKSLKEENPGIYTTIANRANGLNSTFKNVSFKGRVKPKEWEKLVTVHDDFKEMIQQIVEEKVA